MPESDFEKVSRATLVPVAVAVLAVKALDGVKNNDAICEAFDQSKAISCFAALPLCLQDASPRAGRKKIAKDAAFIFEQIQFLPQKMYGENGSADCMNAVNEVLRSYGLEAYFDHNMDGPISGDQVLAHLEAGSVRDIYVATRSLKDGSDSEQYPCDVVIH